jgi:hypothetical protein
MSPRLSSVHRPIRRARQHALARRNRRLWALEGLEGRVLLSGNPTYYTVNLTGDTGASSGTDAYPTAGTPSGDLLWAISQANANTNSAGSVIEFDPTVFASPQMITLSSTLVLSDSAGPEVIEGPGAGVVISGNHAVEVFAVNGGVTATLAGLTISGGSAGYFGGGINNGGALTVTGSNITENSCTGNGDGINNSGALTVVDSTIAGNSGGLYGGGICNRGIVTLTGSTIEANSVAYEGGGIFNGAYGSGAVTVTDSTIEGNSAGAGGGGAGINNAFGGTMTIINSTIANNSAGYNGTAGGIFNDGTLTAVNTTIAYNAASDGGGGLYNNATATLDNTIVALNTNNRYIYQGQPGPGYGDDIDGTPLASSSACNLIGVYNTGSFTNGGNGNIVVGATNPGLGALASNGGPTQTIALLAGSPAIGAGSASIPGVTVPTADQRGVAWPGGAVAIGAYGRPPASSIGPPTVYTVTDTSDGASDTGSLRYAVAQADLNPNLAGSVIQFNIPTRCRPGRAGRRVIPVHGRSEGWFAVPVLAGGGVEGALSMAERVRRDAAAPRPEPSREAGAWPSRLAGLLLVAGWWGQDIGPVRARSPRTGGRRSREATRPRRSGPAGPRA